MRKVGWYFLAFLAMALFATGAFAQTTGSIEGTVVDENNVALPGVTVEATSPALQGTKVAASDTQGKFRLVLLPPGTYTVKFTLSGFAPVEQTEIKVGLGRVVTLNVQMGSAFKEEVVVSGAAPTVDTKSTEVGVNLDKDFFTNLPIGRSYASVVRVAPGTGNDASGITVYGSTGAENAYYIDGINTTGVEVGTQGKTLNFEFVQEVQVKTGGYQAEFGRATGGMINVITKSGGNEFHGDVFGYYDPSSRRATIKQDVKAIASRFTRFTLPTSNVRKDFGADLGGYVVKDTLWFFAAYDRVSETTDNTVVRDPLEFGGPDYGFPHKGDVRKTDSTRDLWSAKLTYRLNPNHSLILSSFGDPVTIDGARAGVVGPETAWKSTQKQGGTDATLKYEGVVGSHWVFNAQAASHKEKYLEDGPGANIVGVTDRTHPLRLRTGLDVRTGGLGYLEEQHFGRDVYRADATYFLNDLAGDHELKAGLEYEHVTVDQTRFYSGGQFKYNFGDFWLHRFFSNRRPPNNDYSQLDNSYIAPFLALKSKTNNQAVYLQDTWRIASNLTLNLGLRWEGQKLYNKAGDVNLHIKDNWAPRLGVVWDFLGNGRSKAFAHYGRFYETIPMDMVIRSFGGEITTFSYNYDGVDDVSCHPDFQGGDCAALGGDFEPVDPSTKGQFIEEVVAGGEYELMKDLGVGAKYIYRSLGRVIEDSLAPDQNYYIGNPGHGLLTRACDLNYTCTYPVPDPKRIFKGVELTVRKRFSNNWALLASYLWSKLEGNYDGTFQASTGQLDPNINSAYDYAEFQVHNYGYLSNDRRHQFKLDGYYTFPFGLTAGLSAFYRTGTPITAMGYSRDYGNWEFYLSKRGVWDRVKDQYEADVHLDYPVRFSGIELRVLLDVFNALNRQGEVSRNMRYDTRQDVNLMPIDYSTHQERPPLRPGTPCQSVAQRPAYCNPSFNTANAWQDPRSVRFGIRLTF
jgi:hypothetical protein